MGWSMENASPLGPEPCRGQTPDLGGALWAEQPDWITRLKKSAASCRHWWACCSELPVVSLLSLGGVFDRGRKPGE